MADRQWLVRCVHRCYETRLLGHQGSEQASNANVRCGLRLSCDPVRRPRHCWRYPRLLHTIHCSVYYVHLSPFIPPQFQPSNRAMSTYTSILKPPTQTTTHPQPTTKVDHHHHHQYTRLRPTNERSENISLHADLNHPLQLQLQLQLPHSPHSIPSRPIPLRRIRSCPRPSISHDTVKQS